MAKGKTQEDPQTRARSAALRLLARREHSRYELAIKLRQRRLEPEVYEPVLDEFEAEGWLSDERFAEVYTRQRVELGYGPLRILGELQQRGIHWTPEQLAQTSTHQWAERAEQLRARRFGLADIRDDRDEKGRQARFLCRRGFTAEQVQRALEAREE
ncbi:MAG TPA: recombinase RecX [Marinobacter sp.]|nr:recombinase RecX [Marinobacter sp.]